MPNKRHPAKKYIGFWGTAFLKDSLKKHAVKKKMTLSVLVAKILLEFVQKGGMEIVVATLFIENS
jgi:hypothetical protein